MVDSSESFGGMYFGFKKEFGISLRDMIADYFSLIKLGLIRFEAGKNILNIKEFIKFYDRLDEEIMKAGGEQIYYSKGEIYFELTNKGLLEWEKNIYRKYDS